METLSFKRSQESACCSKYSKGSISLLSQSVPGCFLYPIKTDLHLKSGTGKKNTQLYVERLKNTNLKSGMPLAVLIPAPATTTTFLQRPSFTRRATEARPPRDEDLAETTEGLLRSGLDPED